MTACTFEGLFGLISMVVQARIAEQLRPHLGEAILGCVKGLLVAGTSAWRTRSNQW